MKKIVLIFFFPIFIFSQCEYDEIEGFNYGGYFQGSHYYISQETSTWLEANENINELGYGHFVTISSEEENNFLTEMINSETFLPYTLYNGYPQVWIGLYQDCPNNDECETNQTGWQWMNNEEIVYTNWFCGDTGPGCPGSTTEDVGILWSNPPGTWNDGLFNSGGELSSILELPCNADMDGDGIVDSEDDDIDGDGIVDSEDDDIDGDGIINIDDSDMDGDGVVNSEDEDMDGDGILDNEDNFLPIGTFIQDCSDQITPNDTDGIFNLEDLFFILDSWLEIWPQENE